MILENGVRKKKITIYGQYIVASNLENNMILLFISVDITDMPSLEYITSNLLHLLDQWFTSANCLHFFLYYYH